MYEKRTHFERKKDGESGCEWDRDGAIDILLYAKGQLIHFVRLN